MPHLKNRVLLREFATTGNLIPESNEIASGLGAHLSLRYQLIAGMLRRPSAWCFSWDHGLRSQGECSSPTVLISYECWRGVKNDKRIFRTDNALRADVWTMSIFRS